MKSTLASLTSSLVPGTNIKGKFNHGPANSLISEASDALDDFRDEHLLERRLEWLVRRTFKIDNRQNKRHDIQ